MDEAQRIRIEMANEGWHSNDRISDMGWGSTFGYSIWFERWDWHGKRLHGNKACYHAHRAGLSHIPETVKQAADLAKRAWAEFPDDPPRMWANGTLAPDPMREYCESATAPR